ncbi:hypothetical protein CEB3_c39920 [Peptococcaceae bacterium CEB3]|nr:hypothetical protein CEB3_c39920 [Peptococcaceae bacterium CEB3]
MSRATGRKRRDIFWIRPSGFRHVHLRRQPWKFVERGLVFSQDNDIMNARISIMTKNGTGDMVVMSIETYERQQALIELYGKLAEAEVEIANGVEGKDFFEVAKKLRAYVHGKV